MSVPAFRHAECFRTPAGPPEPSCRSGSFASSIVTPARFALLAALVLLIAGCRSAGQGATPGSIREVTVYTSLDRPYAEPVLRAFEQRSGVRVRAVYDAEATKSVGLA